MREHAIPLAKEAMATLSKRYNFTPAGPILIEMFPKHDDFAVRTIGLPGMIGALGACFGRVVTLDSPKARPPGDFNWGETLWHELAHVFTIQMSKQRVPRWLTEGVSVWEERRARPEWGREMDMTLRARPQRGQGHEARRAQSGLPGSEDDLAGLLPGLAGRRALVETYGEPKLHALLRAYGEGLEDETAIKEALGASFAQLQASFDARIEKQYAGLRRALKTPELKEKMSVEDLKAAAAANPESFGVQMRLAQALHEAKDSAGAIAALERAAQLIPSANGANNPHTMIAKIALERKDTARAIRALEAVMRVDHSDVESARKLAELVAPARRRRPAPRMPTVVSWRSIPSIAEAEAALGRLALKRKDAVTAVRSFRSVLGSNPPDLAQAHVELAEAHLAAGQYAEAKRQTLAALEIAPSFERAQDLLLKISEQK